MTFSAGFQIFGQFYYAVYMILMRRVEDMKSIIAKGLEKWGKKIIAAFRDHSIPAPLVTYIFLVYTLVFIPRHRTAFLYSDWP